MIGCNGDCDNCTEDGAERKRQEIINKLNDDLKVLDNIYWDRFNAIEENKERTNTTVDLSGISKEDLEKELARRANK